MKNRSNLNPIERMVIRLLLAVLLAGALGVQTVSCSRTEAAESGSLEDDEVVYICTGPKAKVYHATEDCRGLERCSGEVKAVPKTSTRRRPCRICYE